MDTEIERLKRALSVLYYGVDISLRRLAENEYSGCASTQREDPFELKKALERRSTDES